MNTDHPAESSWLDRRTRFIVPVVSRLQADTQFAKPLADLSSFLSRSLEFRADAVRLLELECDMAGFLLSAQDEQKRLERQLADESPPKGAGRKELEVLSGVCRHLQAILKQIADGVAWRCLEYDRALIHALSLKPHTGHMQQKSAETEVVAAGLHVEETGEIVVINDLTNFLRYGDFTSIGTQAITIHEVKGGRGAAVSGKASRQKRKLASVIDFITRGHVDTPEGPRKIVWLRSRPVSHLNEVSELIQRARISGRAHARLSDCLSVNVLERKYCSEVFNKGTTLRQLISNPFEQSRHATSFDSIRLIAGFSRNVAPYAIFPFPLEDRLAIMTGSIWIISYFNFGNVIRCLRRRGLYAEPPTREGMNELQGLPPGEVAKRELDNPFVISRGGGRFVLKTPLSSIARMPLEFLDEESFVDMVDEKLSMAEGMSEPTFLHTALELEGDLWD